MSFRRWKLGVFVTFLFSLFVAGSGIAAGGGWKVFVSVFCSAMLTHFGTWISKHPVEDVSFDTKTFVNPNPPLNNPTKEKQ